MTDVFINYAQEDSFLAQHLATGLQSRGLSVAMEPDLEPGVDFVEAIQNVMASASCVITLWSHRSVNSNWVKAGAQWAMARRKLLPVAIDEVEIPPEFRRVHTTIVRVSESNWADQLIEDIKQFTQRRNDRGQPSEQLVGSEYLQFRRPKRPDRPSSVSAPDAVGVRKKAFVSYADEDEKIAIDVVQYLEASGCPCWISFRDVDPGDDYRRSITKAMDEVVFLVLVYSSHVNTSFDIATELLLARKRGRKRFVLRMDGTEPDGPLEYELATVQWIDCISDRKAGLDRIGRRAAIL